MVKDGVSSNKGSGKEQQGGEEDPITWKEQQAQQE
jgi:hypothetical protein